MKAGVGLAAADAVAVGEAVAGLLEDVPALGRGAWEGVARELADGAGRACAAGAPAKVSRVTLTAAAIHTATAVVAIAAPGLARIFPQLARLIARENSAAHVDSARRTTLRR